MRGSGVCQGISVAQYNEQGDADTRAHLAKLTASAEFVAWQERKAAWRRRRPALAAHAMVTTLIALGAAIVNWHGAPAAPPLLALPLGGEAWGARGADGGRKDSRPQNQVPHAPEKLRGYERLLSAPATPRGDPIRAYHTPAADVVPRRDLEAAVRRVQHAEETQRAAIWQRESCSLALRKAQADRDKLADQLRAKAAETEALRRQLSTAQPARAAEATDALRQLAAAWQEGRRLLAQREVLVGKMNVMWAVGAGLEGQLEAAEARHAKDQGAIAALQGQLALAQAKCVEQQQQLHGLQRALQERVDGGPSDMEVADEAEAMEDVAHGAPDVAASEAAQAPAFARPPAQQAAGAAARPVPAFLQRMKQEWAGAARGAQDHTGPSSVGGGFWLASGGGSGGCFWPAGGGGSGGAFASGTGCFLAGGATAASNSGGGDSGLSCLVGAAAGASGLCAATRFHPGGTGEALNRGFAASAPRSPAAPAVHRPEPRPAGLGWLSGASGAGGNVVRNLPATMHLQMLLDLQLESALPATHVATP
ncbi:hypothetical protein WJX81_005521 [Elliptochloris bilobata]|uniref:Uncharacterized protein n=1 Tax=Elliptochloris bilobata TaxID=381761 RepID=A0AAW1RRD5_9CHLO